MALVVFAYYDPTIVETDILCLPYSCIAIDAVRLIDCLIDYPALVVVIAAAAIVAAATTTTIAAVTTALAYDTVG
jgi:hypothetical protein